MTIREWTKSFAICFISKIRNIFLYSAVTHFQVMGSTPETWPAGSRGPICCSDGTRASTYTFIIFTFDPSQRVNSSLLTQSE